MAALPYPPGMQYQQPMPVAPQGYIQNQPMGYGGQYQGPAYPQPPQPPPMPGSIPGVTPGLEGLYFLDRFFVKQELELLEVLSGFETENKYQVLDLFNNNLYYAMEESSCCSRICAATRRPFTIHITDKVGREVMQVKRPYGCCNQEVSVFAPPGNLIGSVQEKCACCEQKLVVENQRGDETLIIKGPWCTTACCGGDVVFEIEANGAKIGQITKKWSGYVQEAMTDTDNFLATFPRDLDVNAKASLLGATLLIDYLFYEEPAHKDR